MPTIYANSFIHSDELNSNNMLEVFLDHASKLEEVAATYRHLVSVLKEKNITIHQARGFSHAAQFEVDEIDAARLMNDGLVIDYSKGAPNLNPTFYIDPELDNMLEDNFESISEILAQELGPPSDPEPTDEGDSDDEPFREQSSQFNLTDILEVPDQASSVVGSIGIDVTKFDEDKYSFDLTIQDLGLQPQNVHFDRPTGEIKFKCSSCEEWHLEPLQNVFNSLITATALISNFVEMSQATREFSAALELIEHDLRLLQELVKFDYALEDPRDSLNPESDESSDERE